jgi:hypothetical protein
VVTIIYSLLLLSCLTLTGTMYERISMGSRLDRMSVDSRLTVSCPNPLVVPAQAAKTAWL